MAALWQAVEMMRAIVGKASSGSFTTARLAFDEIEWPRDPYANLQIAYFKTSEGTWLTVAVTQSQEDPR